MEEFFASIDKNGDGRITFDEWYEFTKACNPTVTLEEAQEGFNEIDANHDGAIDAAEFQRLYDAQLQEAFAVVDKDGDGRISFEEWLEYGRSLNADLTEEAARVGFERFDLDRDGSLDLAEFKAILASAKREELRRAEFAAIDENGDGVITFDEYLKYVRTLDQNTPQEELRKEFDRFDTNSDGHIDYDEFHALYINTLSDDPEDKKEALFAQIDSNGDGAISFDEWFAFMAAENPALSRGEAKKDFDEIDINHDGLISLAEFKAL